MVKNTSTSIYFCIFSQLNCDSNKKKKKNSDDWNIQDSSPDTEKLKHGSTAHRLAVDITYIGTLTIK